jgi:hypothetical protein
MDQKGFGRKQSRYYPDILAGEAEKNERERKKRKRPATKIQTENLLNTSLE